MARLSLPKRVAFSLMVSVGVWLAAEAAVTALYGPELRAWESPPPSPQQGVSVMQGNPYLLYEYPPGEHYERGVTVRINSLAMRGPEPDMPKPPGRRRFITTGDSSVFGFGVPEQAVFSSVAADRLGDDVEAIIGAVPGYSSFQSINLLQMRALKTEPDLLVIANIWSDNNFDAFVDKEVLAEMAGSEGGAVGRLRKLLSRSAIFRVADWKLRVKKSSEKVRKVAWQQDSQSRGQIGLRRVEINDYAQNLENLVQMARAHGAEALFVILANNEDVKSGGPVKAGPKAWDPYRQVMRDAAARHCAPVIDVPALFLEAKRGPSELFLDEMHPTVEGHRIMGEALAAVLAEHDWATGGRVMCGDRGGDVPEYADPFIQGTAAQAGPGGGGPPAGQASQAPPDGVRIDGTIKFSGYEQGRILLEAIAADSGDNPQVIANIHVERGEAPFVIPVGRPIKVALRAYYDADADGPDGDDQLFEFRDAVIDLTSGPAHGIVVDLDQRTVTVGDAPR